MTTPLPVPQILLQAVRLYPATVAHLSDDAIAVIKAAGYDGIRTVMRGAVFGSVFGYLSGGSLADARSRMELAVSKAYIETADAGYSDGGGDLPLDPDTAAWARGQLDAQLGFVDELFEGLKQVRKDGGFDAGSIANARAEGYASGLDGFYNEAKLHGSKNIIGYWRLGSTERHCRDCASLDGKGHRLQWYIDHNYIPRKPGASMECHGYRCDCSIVDRNGNELTI